MSAEDGRPVIAHLNGDPVEHTPFSAEPRGEVHLLVPPAG